MLSDWHLGSGAGRHGFVDRGVQRDDDGLPFVPAKTLVGVWRDACETAARALDGGGTESFGWRMWVEFLFGGQPALQERGVVPDAGALRPPRPAALHVDSLHYPPQVAAALRSRPLLRAEAVFVKPGVVIDPVTGRAEDELLRMEEMARGGIDVTGRAELTSAGGVELTGEQLACAAGLLDAGARLVEALGGRRRRGAGRCRLEVSGLPYDWQWLQGRSAAAVPEPATGPVPTALPETYGLRRARAGAEPGAGAGAETGTEPGTEAGTEPGAEPAWEAADLRLVLRRALVAHERTVGNTVRSAGRVPGRVLLPAVLERLGSAEAATAARAGRLVVTDATLEVAGQAGRAEPLALAQAKGEPGLLFNGLQEQPGNGVVAEPVDGSGYVGPYRFGEPPQRAECVFTQHTHNTVDDTLQRPVAEVGGLYTYQAIAAGTVLRAQVRLPAGLVPPGWQERLSGTWRLGQARKDGYGLCEVGATAADLGRTRSERTGQRKGPGGRLRVWLLSDALVVDERLRPSSRVADLARVLGDALGVVLAEVPPQAPVAAGGGTEAEGGDAERAGVRFSEVGRSDPWHARWGLPRASLLGLRAGSCLTLEVVSGTLTPQAVARVECEGVGLRRAEGFGQLLIDDPLLYASLADLAPVRTPAECGPPTGVPTAPGGDDGEGLTNEAASALTVLEEAAWRAAMRRHGPVVARAGRDEVLGTGHHTVRSSQLAGLLPLVSRLGGPDDEAARAWLERLRRVPGERRRRPWPDTVVEAVTALLCEPGRVWELLGLPEEELATGPARVGALRARLWTVAVRTLVEDCLTALRRDETARRTDTASRRA
ncbi:RAMP superfamily CRISPR-associated protein [Streptomyces sp. NPDC052535]|uniref:RAMP superfamily CRISPR-associated protein n=1 Tax=Streptomyces sp. NPDC052535 TaxID=3155531 RepID=UPI003414277A